MPRPSDSAGGDGGDGATSGGPGISLGRPVTLELTVCPVKMGLELRRLRSVGGAGGDNNAAIGGSGGSASAGTSSATGATAL